jgi:hypothetical protein
MLTPPPATLPLTVELLVTAGIGGLVQCWVKRGRPAPVTESTGKVVYTLKMPYL